MDVYGNKTWNNATDNRDKSVIPMAEDTFRKIQQQLENSGINYYAYSKNSKTVMVVNDKDLEWFRSIVGKDTDKMEIRKTDVVYTPPQKNIIGNAEYRYIPQKKYVSLDSDTALKMAEIMDKQNIQFSGRVSANGKTTLTISQPDFEKVSKIKDSVIAMRKQFAKDEKADEIIGNKAYRDIQNKHYFHSKMKPEEYKEIQPFLDEIAEYSGLIRDGKVIFTVENDDSYAFYIALESSHHEAEIYHDLADAGLGEAHISQLKEVIHKIAAEDVHISLENFFDERYSDEQFSHMKQLTEKYLEQSPFERMGKNSVLSDMLKAKNDFDKEIEMVDFFSEHTYSDGQKALITEMFMNNEPRSFIDAIDESFSQADIQKYNELLHGHKNVSDITDFLEEHKQAVIDRENAERVPKEEEVLFPQADLARFLAERTLSSDEWEDMAYPLFENGYLDKHQPNDKGAFGYNLSEIEFYDLARRYHNGDDIRRELALGLLEGGKAFDMEFVFEDGKISDRTFYYAENLRHTLHAEKTEDGYKCSFGGMERFVSFEEIGQAFLDRTHEEFEDLMYWRVLDYIKDDIPDIADETVQQLITAFDGAALLDWEKGDNVPKLNRIKKALFDILGDEEQTEKAFACIAKQKYNVTFEAEKPESSIHFGLLGNGITAYDVSRTDKETNDYPTVAHISPEGVIKIYDDSLSADDMKRINEQAQSAREKFMTEWDSLSTTTQLQRLYDRADTETMLNIGKENLSTEEKIAKYMPFVFFGEGERPKPEIVPENKDLGSVSLRKVGNFYEMYGKNAEIGAEVLGLHMMSKNGSPMVGFPDYVKDEYSKKLGEAGYSVLIEEVFEINPPKREQEYFLEVSMTSDAFDEPYCIAKVDADGEFIDYYEDIDGYIPTFSTIAEVLDFAEKQNLAVTNDLEEITENLLDKAKALINDFCEEEYRDGADFSDLHNVSLAYTTLTDDELPIQVTANLLDHKITYKFDGEVFNTEQYDSIEDMIEKGLTGLDFNNLVSVPDGIIEKSIRARTSRRLTL